MSMDHQDKAKEMQASLSNGMVQLGTTRSEIHTDSKRVDGCDKVEKKITCREESCPTLGNQEMSMYGSRVANPAIDG